MHEASGLFSLTMERLAFASRQFAPKTVDPSVRLISVNFVQFFLVSQGSGWRKPPAERRALCIHIYAFGASGDESKMKQIYAFSIIIYYLLYASVAL